MNARLSCRQLLLVLLPLWLFVGCSDGAVLPLPDLGLPPVDGAVPGDGAVRPDAVVVPDGPGPTDGVSPPPPDQPVPPPDGGPPPDGTPPPPPERPALYPDGLTQSPLTPAVVANLQRIAAAGASRQAAVFAKIGDSQTVSTSFVTCFDGANVDLDVSSALEETRAFFAGGDAAGASPYDRVTLAATVGWSARSAVAGDPSPVEQEMAAIDPRYAVVMFGSNDVESRNIFNFATSMGAIADTLIAGGVIPLFTSAPPRNDSAASDAEIPRYNAVVRALAQVRQIPFIDLHRELLPIPDRGLGGDGLHLNTYVSGGARGCVLTPAGLQFGNNLRNLVTLESLDRTRAAVEDGVSSDASAPALEGQGTRESPFLIAGFPFGDARDTRSDGQSLIASYPGCAAAQDESGSEVYYRLDLAETTTVRAYVFDEGEVDIDLHLTDASATGEGCLQRNDREITATLQAGTYHFVLDTFVSSGTPRPGPYLFVVVKE